MDDGRLPPNGDTNGGKAVHQRRGALESVVAPTLRRRLIPGHGKRIAPAEHFWVRQAGHPARGVLYPRHLDDGHYGLLFSRPRLGDERRGEKGECSAHDYNESNTS